MTYAASIRNDIWWPLTGQVSGLEDPETAQSPRLEALRGWARSPATRQIFLDEAMTLFEQSQLGNPIGPLKSKSEEAEEVMAVVAFIVLENYPHAACPWAMDYLVARWAAPDLLDHLDGIRYLAGALGSLTEEEVRRIPFGQINSIFDHCRDGVVEAVAEELGATSQPLVAEIVRAYTTNPSSKNSRYLSWIPIRIDYNCIQERQNRVDFLKKQLAIPAPDSISVHDLEGLYWVLDQASRVQAIEVLPELRTLETNLESCGRSNWILTGKIRDIIVRLSK